MAGNGRYGGGQAGPEHRHHFPAVDAARHEDATMGSVVKAKDHGDMPATLPAAKASTMAGGRGVKVGAKLPQDRGGF